MKEICAALEEMELRQVKFFLNIQIFYSNISSARRSCGGWRRSLRSGCTTCSPRARRCSGPSPASSLTSAWTRRRRGPRPPAGGPPGCSPGRPPWHPWSPSVFYLNLQKRIILIIIHVGAARGYDEELLGGFLARSRQQSLDRRGGGDKQEKEREASTKEAAKASTKEAAKVSDKEAEADKPPTEKKGKKPPAAPRRKRDK